MSIQNSIEKKSEIKIKNLFSLYSVSTLQLLLIVVVRYIKVYLFLN